MQEGGLPLLPVRKPAPPNPFPLCATLSAAAEPIIFPGRGEGTAGEWNAAQLGRPPAPSSCSLALIHGAATGRDYTRQPTGCAVAWRQRDGNGGWGRRRTGNGVAEGGGRGGERRPSPTSTERRGVPSTPGAAALE